MAKIVRINEIHLPTALKHLISEQFANSLSLIVTFLIKFVIHLSCIIIKNENMKNKIKTINQQTNRFNILILHIIGIEDEKLLKPLDLKLFFIR